MKTGGLVFSYSPYQSFLHTIEDFMSPEDYESTVKFLKELTNKINMEDNKDKKYISKINITNIKKHQHQIDLEELVDDEDKENDDEDAHED